MKNLFNIILLQIRLIPVAILFITSYSSCNSNSGIIPVHSQIAHPGTQKLVGLAKTGILPPADAATILQRPQVPILCYHRIRNFLPTDSRTMKDYIVPLNNFQDQMKMLAENGYHSILPDQLYDYLVLGTALPTRPVMITFDDSREEQFTVAREEMKKYGFKGVYFIMTVALGRPGYMTRDQVRELADEGNIIGSHTWNHSNVKNYKEQDWVTQIDKPSRELEKITGQPIEYFAFPFGLWNKLAVEELKQRHFKAAFQLSAKRDETDPLFTIRRMIVPGEWGTPTLQKWVNNSF